MGMDYFAHLHDAWCEGDGLAKGESMLMKYLVIAVVIRAGRFKCTSGRRESNDRKA